MPYGDYLVYVDESGDHELTKIDPQYPVFVLLFCIIRKDDYLAQVCPDLQRFKFEFWGHDEVVLHEHEIRKPHGHFLFLLQKPLRERFLSRLSDLMVALPATVVAVVIDKPALVASYHTHIGPYDYAMEVGLERVFRELDDRGQGGKTTPVIVECRGRKEDCELELAFRRVCDGANALHRPLPFSLAMVPKSANSSGLQLTDLMARPVGLKHLRPTQPNRAFDIIESKLWRSPSGKIEGWGIKHLP
ncbi:MAG: DUF3800 domain-containing protein [Opitutus sp.]|nr:DUF3800 domain-containing protein [Opitutus sp.]MCS6246368.1 DUF3800 domain-containing protein [Opitutus sp.]MCS6275305.1 DUF3800 domain-containing protein [Opitutus sp.]MCS6278302.1 DUF3800 domain-containing protein [Opitutus sp.]MCS6299412.1 DUF3800 domain-containing protein [Opitutus sp.]